jgi:large subunit ribosomal protein L21
MYAIVVTGGKQYRVEVDDLIEVEKLEVEPGGTVELNVVFLADGSTITTDAAALATAKVFASVVEQFKGDKQIIFKFKKRKGYKRLRGHRQNLTRLKIEAISLDGKPPKATSAKKATAKPKDEKPEKKVAAEPLVEDEAPSEASEEKPAKKPARKPAKKKEAVEESAEAAETAEAAEEQPVKKTRTRKPKVEEAPVEEAPVEEAAPEEAPAEEKPTEDTPTEVETPEKAEED